MLKNVQCKICINILNKNAKNSWVYEIICVYYPK